MKKILIYEPSILSENIGDFIILDAVKEHLYDIFPTGMYFNAITQDYMPKRQYILNKQCDFSFVAGTNIINSKMRKFRRWRLRDTLYVDNMILMGVGWGSYQKQPDLYTKILYKRLFNNNILHSVRDTYSEKKLISAGIENVINTGCPTMWNLTKEHCAYIPQEKSKNVVFTLTDYLQDIENDKLLIKLLQQNYQKVYFWPQGSGDMQYLKKISSLENIKIVGGNLKSYNSLLEDENIGLDYIGTRLHGGIRALQKFRRSIIISIDNRAREKANDFNLIIIERKKLKTDLEMLINSNFKTEIDINLKNIHIWKSQFNQSG